MLGGFESVAPSLTKDDVERFSRQMLCDGIGAFGMERIRRTHVVCVGMGGLGSTVALYLVAGGIGKLTIIDFDVVELCNLHRQVIHTFDKLGMPKVISAKKACLSINPDAAVEGIQVQLSPDNAEHLLRDADVVVDASDNVAARYLVNDAAMRLGKPLVSGSAVRWDGQLSVYGYQSGPCYRCLFPEAPPADTVVNCSNVGVVGPVPGMIGCLQALEVFKVAAQVGTPLTGRMLIFNGLRMSTQVIELRSRNPECKACGDKALANRTIPLSELMRRGQSEYSMTTGSCTGRALNGDALPEKLCVSPQTFSLRWGRRQLRPCEPSMAYAKSSELLNTMDYVSDKNSSWTLCIDVRPPEQYEMAHLRGSFSLPLGVLQEWHAAGQLRSRFSKYVRSSLKTHLSRLGRISEESSEMQKESTVTPSHKVPLNPNAGCCEVFFICRRGLTSVKAVQLLLKLSLPSQEGLILVDSIEEGEEEKEKEKLVLGQEAVPKQIKVLVLNVNGGLNAYHLEVDSNFPFY